MSSPETPSGCETTRAQARPGARPGNARKLVLGLAVLALVLLAVDILVPRHGPFAMERWFGFYALFGFGAAVGLVLIARAWRLAVMRREHYYDQ